jgi:long-chain acyl-CoA synthetase
VLVRRCAGAHRGVQLDSPPAVLHINGGGQKVYPAEVESVILEMDSVSGVEVFGTPNPISGNMVCARVVLKAPEDPREFTHKLKTFCGARLENFKGLTRC